jgi:hypothetical protein
VRWLSFNSSAKGGGSDWIFRIQLVAEELAAEERKGDR